jgi:hypothetical protein
MNGLPYLAFSALANLNRRWVVQRLELTEEQLEKTDQQRVDAHARPLLGPDNRRSPDCPVKSVFAIGVGH